MAAGRTLVIAALLVVALLVQLSVAPVLFPTAVVPDVVLLVVAAVGLRDGAVAGAWTGFAGGLLIDLAPPSDDLMGQWALALCVVGLLAGTVDRGSRSTRWLDLVVSGAAAFVGVSIFALSSIVLGLAGADLAVASSVVGLAVAYDAVLGLLVLPLVRAALDRVEPTPVRGW
ncbi:rod shape-determining protein MreD [Mumia flava]|uniref:Rod shape-determining protein MreD n=1 Tax=Mumia flava TaxID=1348852 RepID=A0A2M9B7T9_9ACTN|nr:rod shape-determining protein MreD [Mumia flava]PJJ54004.1 rod shape-determining protein MreD [Mumia flava]